MVFNSRLFPGRGERWKKKLGGREKINWGDKETEDGNWNDVKEEEAELSNERAVGFSRIGRECRWVLYFKCKEQTWKENGKTATACPELFFVPAHAACMSPSWAASAPPRHRLLQSGRKPPLPTHPASLSLFLAQWNSRWCFPLIPCPQSPNWGRPWEETPHSLGLPCSALSDHSSLFALRQRCSRFLVLSFHGALIF